MISDQNLRHFYRNQISELNVNIMDRYYYYISFFFYLSNITIISVKPTAKMGFSHWKKKRILKL
jgi:hypothetical protein